VVQFEIHRASSGNPCHVSCVYALGCTILLCVWWRVACPESRLGKPQLSASSAKSPATKCPRRSGAFCYGNQGPNSREGRFNCTTTGCIRRPTIRVNVVSLRSARPSRLGGEHLTRGSVTAKFQGDQNARPKRLEKYLRKSPIVTPV
jgi:hypothetical protein